MRTICLLACLIGMAMSAWSQNLVLGQEEETDDAIAVVGYFCKNDTMTYTRTTSKYKIVEGDTTMTNSFQEEFMIVVTDSTSKGYKMKLIPLDVHFNGADDDEDEDNFLLKSLNQALGKIVCEFTTDELGQVQRIDNWRAIRDEVKKGIKLMCDTLYAAQPGMDSIMPRKQLEKILQLRFSTEEGVRESYEELEELFGLHGSTFDIGD